MLFLSAFLFSLVTVFGQKCPAGEEVTYQAHSSHCDQYTECREGVTSEHTCPDGLLFNDQITNGRTPCDYPNEVDCGTRSQRQLAQPTEHCGHAWGYFAAKDRSQCGEFWNCVDGREFQFTCPEGLAFSSNTNRCEWADQSPDCDVEAYLGFSCPNEPEQRQAQPSHGHARLRSPRDCRNFFICVDTSPRLNSCELGLVFNELISDCDEPENVKACSNYYPAEELKLIRERKLKAIQAEEERQLKIQERQLQTGKTTQVRKENPSQESQLQTGKTTQVRKENPSQESQLQTGKTTQVRKENPSQERQLETGKTTQVRKENPSQERQLKSKKL